MKVTNQNLIIPLGGGAQKHYPIWVDDKNTQYISLDGRTFVDISGPEYKIYRRENAIRK